jgi:hypothetical protein
MNNEIRREERERNKKKERSLLLLYNSKTKLHIIRLLFLYTLVILKTKVKRTCVEILAKLKMNLYLSAAWA